MHDSLSRGMATRSAQHYKKVFRHLPGRYYSESNRTAILLGRVDLRVDHGHFGNHMKFQESPRADNPVRLSRIGSGPRLCIH